MSTITHNFYEYFKILLTTVVAVYMHFDLAQIPKYFLKIYFYFEDLMEIFPFDYMIFVLKWIFAAMTIFIIYILLNRKAYLNHKTLTCLEISKRMAEFKFAVMVSEIHRLESKQNFNIWKTTTKLSSISRSKLHNRIFKFTTEAYKILLSETSESTEELN